MGWWWSFTLYHNGWDSSARQGMIIVVGVIYLCWIQLLYKGTSLTISLLFRCLSNVCLAYKVGPCILFHLMPIIGQDATSSWGVWFYRCCLPLREILGSICVVLLHPHLLQAVMIIMLKSTGGTNIENLIPIYRMVLWNN